MRLKKTIIIFLISLILLNISLVYAINSNKTNENYFRIHVVANSDSIDDQILKYTLSKNVNQYISELTKGCFSKEDCKKVIEENIQSILQISHKTLKDNNCNYNVKAYIGKQIYDEKKMNNIYMEAGVYDSLKIVIGNGQGQNWWSLIYPTTFSNINEQDIFNEDTNYSLGILELLKKLFI